MQPPTTDVLILLIDIDSKRFELLTLDHDVHTVQDCLQQIPLCATDPFLKQQQEYVGLCDPMRMMMEPPYSKSTLGTKEERVPFSSSHMFVAIPKHKTAYECVTLARSILATQAVVQTVRRC